MSTITKTIFVLAALASTGIAHAQSSKSDKSTLHISGKVDLDCSIRVDATTIASNINIIGGESNSIAGVVTENCNSGNGYSITITSKNQDNLQSGTNKNISYAATYDDGTGTISTEIVAKRNIAQFGRKGNFAITLPAVPTAEAGSYNDQITFVIAAK